MGLHLDAQRNLIQPDKYLLSQAVKSYQAGGNQTALSYFKKSSSLGNAMAQRYVGLMYVNGLGVNKDYVTGYAWLKLAAHDNTQKNKDLRDQVYKLLTELQKEQSVNVYDTINNQYGEIAALTRRDRWVRKQKMKMTGSRTGSLVFAPLSFDTPHGNGIYNQIKSYVEDYNFGYITSGDIIPKNEETLEK
jgi:TPR repeat protein